jgi:hypothetical protein
MLTERSAFGPARADVAPMTRPARTAARVTPVRTRRGRVSGLSWWLKANCCCAAVFIVIPFAWWCCCTRADLLFAEEASKRTHSTRLHGQLIGAGTPLSLASQGKPTLHLGTTGFWWSGYRESREWYCRPGCLTPAGSASGSCCIWPVTSVCGKPWPWRRRLHDAFRGRDALETPRGCGVRRPSLHLTHSGFRSASDPTSQPHVTVINRSAARYTCYAQPNGPTPPRLSICLGYKVPAPRHGHQPVRDTLHLLRSAGRSRLRVLDNLSLEPGSQQLNL